MAQHLLTPDARKWWETIDDPVSVDLATYVMLRRDREQESAREEENEDEEVDRDQNSANG